VIAQYKSENCSVEVKKPVRGREGRCWSFPCRSRARKRHKTTPSIPIQNVLDISWFFTCCRLWRNQL